MTNPARLNLPGTEPPAGIALKVSEPRKLHHHVKVMTHGEGNNYLLDFKLQRDRYC